MDELSSVNCEIVSFRPTALLEVILYGDKMFNDKSIHQKPITTINYLKRCSGWNKPYFEYLMVILSNSYLKMF